MLASTNPATGENFVFRSSEDSVALGTEVALLPLLVTRVTHSVTVHLVTLGVDLSFKDPLQRLVLVVLPSWTLRATALTGGTTPTVPSASRDLGQSNAVDVESSVAEVTEEHLLLVLRFVATDTLLAVSTLPLIAGDELGEQQLVIGPTSEGQRRLIFTWIRSRLRPIHVGWED